MTFLIRMLLLGIFVSACQPTEKTNRTTNFAEPADDNLNSLSISSSSPSPDPTTYSWKIEPLMSTADYRNIGIEPASENPMAPIIKVDESGNAIFIVSLSGYLIVNGAVTETKVKKYAYKLFSKGQNSWSVLKTISVSETEIQSMDFDFDIQGNGTFAYCSAQTIGFINFTAALGFESNQTTLSRVAPTICSSIDIEINTQRTRSNRFQGSKAVTWTQGTNENSFFSLATLRNNEANWNVSYSGGAFGVNVRMHISPSGEIINTWTNLSNFVVYWMKTENLTPCTNQMFEKCGKIIASEFGRVKSSNSTVDVNGNTLLYVGGEDDFSNPPIPKPGFAIFTVDGNGQSIANSGTLYPDLQVQCGPMGAVGAIGGWKYRTEFFINRRGQSAFTTKCLRLSSTNNPTFKYLGSFSNYPNEGWLSNYRNLADNVYIDTPNPFSTTWLSGLSNFGTRFSVTSSYGVGEDYNINFSALHANGEVNLNKQRYSALGLYGGSSYPISNMSMDVDQEGRAKVVICKRPPNTATVHCYLARFD